MINSFKLTQRNYLIAVVAGITLLTIVTGTIFLMGFNFDGIEFNGDSYVYYSYAKHFSASVSKAAFPKPAYWPYGYPALLSLSFAIGDVSFESARWVNVICGGLLSAVLCSVLFLISQIKKMPFDEAVLIIATVGLLPLGHGLFIKYQLTMMSDMTAIFLSTLVMLLCWRWRASDNLFYILLAGFVFGLSMLTRYVNALMLLPTLVVLLCDTDLKQIHTLRRTLLAAFLFGGCALIAFAPQLYITVQDTSSSLGNGLLNGWSIKNFFTMTHESMDGSQPAKVPSVLYYFILPFRLQCFTPLGIILMGLGIKYTLRELPRWLWLSMIVWYLVFYILLCGFSLQNGRIGFSLFIPVVLWMSLGLLECRIIWKNHFTKILLSVSLIWCVSFVFSFKVVMDFVKVKNQLKATAEEVVKVLPPKSRIISTSLYAVYNAYPMAVEPFSIYQMSIQEAENLFDDKTPLYLAVDEKHFIPQWSNYPAGKCFNWIKNNYSCTFRFTINDYTVYEIEPREKILP